MKIFVNDKPVELLSYEELDPAKSYDFIFSNLEELLLSQNQIREIKGLENLEKLQRILLRDNPIKEEEKDLLSQEVQKLVAHCQEKMKV